jgi:hypothetical protein
VLCWNHRPAGEGDAVNKDSSKLLRDSWGDGGYIIDLNSWRDSAMGIIGMGGDLVSLARHFKARAIFHRAAVQIRLLITVRLLN